MSDEAGKFELVGMAMSAGWSRQTDARMVRAYGAALDRAYQGCARGDLDIDGTIEVISMRPLDVGRPLEHTLATLRRLALDALGALRERQRGAD